MAAKWHTVRVFISSTFSDMHAERDYLVKVVFPSLREKLQQYRIHLVDIDLRWGVTKEQADDDRALDLCLQQIDDCRPFFIGILGERYGYVPQHIPDLDNPAYGWVQGMTGKSITELEIIHGALNDHQMRSRSFFFFRDKSFLDEVPDGKRGEMLSEGDEAASQLEQLKETIEGAGVPVYKDYLCRYRGLKINWRLARLKLNQQDLQQLEQVAGDGIVDAQEYAGLNNDQRSFVDNQSVVYLDGLERFGDSVSEQLEYAILNPDPDAPLAAHLLEVQQPQDDPQGLAVETNYHERFMLSRLRVYVGRESIQQQLVEYADSDRTVPCLVTGPSGSGKSAAMAKFVTEFGQSHADVLVIPHFIGASPASTGLRPMLHRFCLILQREFQFAETIERERQPPDVAHVEILPDTNSLVSLFLQLVAKIPADRRVVFVLDALNQLDETDNAHTMYWLPVQLPAHVKIVASSIDDPDREEEVLEAFRYRENAEVIIEPLTDEERFDIVHQVPSLSAKTLDPEQVGLLLANPATTNPLFLLVALEELRGFGSFRELNDRIMHFPRAEDCVTALFVQVIERLETEFGKELVHSIFTLLASARHGLSETELQSLIETDERQENIFAVLCQARPYLQPRGNLIDFFHRGLFKAVRQIYLSSGEQQLAAHGRLAGYFASRLNPANAGSWSGDDSRALAELPYHQTQGECWDPLEQTLTSLPFLEAKNEAGLLFDLAGDFTQAVAALPEVRPQRRILKLLEEALRRDIHFIHRHHQSDEYPQALFQCLWNSCWWYDCDEAAGHYLEPEGGWKVDNAPWLVPVDELTGERKLCDLLQGWRAAKEQRSPRFRWLRSHRPPVTHLGTAQLAILRGHESGVWSVAFSADRQRIVSGAEDATVRLWDAESGAELRCLRQHEKVVCSVAFSPDGRRIVSGSNDHTVRVWDVESGAELRCFLAHESKVSSVAFSPDGRRIVSGLEDQTLRVWDVENGAELLCLRAQANGMWARALRCLDRLPLLRRLRRHDGRVRTAAYSPCGRRIVSGANDHTVRVWDAESGAELRCLRAHESSVTSVVFSPDGRRIASGSSDKTVRVWDVGNGAELHCLGHDHWVKSVVFSQDGCRIVTGSWDKIVRVWDAETGAELRRFRGHESGVSSVAISSDGRRIVSGGGYEDKTVRVWDAESGEELRSLRGHDDAVQRVVFSYDGRQIASGARDETVRVWDTESGAELRCLYGHENSLAGVWFSPDGRRVISGLPFAQAVRVWDAECGGYPEVIEGTLDAAAIAGVSDKFSWRARGWGLETIVEDDATGEVVARYPVNLDHQLRPIKTHPSASTWASTRPGSEHLYIISLEGGE